jgi:hypothetical protein
MVPLSPVVQPSGSECLLEWHPYEKDRTMGLNHQLASLSCILGEAFFLNRTAVLPDRMCLFGLHTERWPGARRQPTPSADRLLACTVFGMLSCLRLEPVCAATSRADGSHRACAPSAGDEGTSEHCVPLGHIFDLPLLSQLVPVQLRSHGRAQAGRKPAQLVRGISSSQVRQLYPCPDVPIVRRSGALTPSASSVPNSSPKSPIPSNSGQNAPKIEKVFQESTRLTNSKGTLRTAFL